MKPVVIRFFAPVIDATVNALMNAVDQKMKQGVDRFIILVSSPGGSVIHGLSAYNYLKGVPASITTHNFGSVDSIGIVLYCAGSKRLSVPQARFLFHGVNVQFRGDQNLEEKVLEERLKGLRVDMENIARVIAANTGRDAKDVTDVMIEGTMLYPEDAKSWGLVHEIKSELFEAGSEVIAIQFQQQPQQPQQLPQQLPQPQPPRGRSIGR
ncbi:MAG: ATP-dependent Clp protease proteolytic subunit [Dehalococcoidia bacterium]|nr:ATP-dependent Clp protease proteolytic subunit [Dehalococcoidia bacterium]